MPPPKVPQRTASSARTCESSPGDRRGTDHGQCERVTPARLAAAALAALASGPLPAQSLPFAVVIVGWERDALEQQRRVFRSAGGRQEILHCVEAWRTKEADSGLHHIVIARLRRATVGTASRIADVGDRCLAPDGRPLPTIHTHADGNCQFSPTDLVTMVARGADFDGVQCGDRHFVWGFARHIAAVAAAAERTRIGASAPDPP